MAGGVIYLERGDELVAMQEQLYDAESKLQELLARYPGLLAGDQINRDAPRRWLLVKREAGIPNEDDGAENFALDHLFLDQDGIPTLVEVKRSTDTRARREVVAQMLDYAANAVAYWPAEQIRAWYEARCENSDPAQGDFTSLSTELDYEAFWGQVATNLNAKKLRLIFVADKIPTELRRIIEFLGEAMRQIEVFGIEIPQFVGQDHRALVPRVIGRVIAPISRPSGPILTRDEFLAFWNGHDRGRSVLERLITFADNSDGKLVVRLSKKSIGLNVVVNGRSFGVLSVYEPGNFGPLFFDYAYISRWVKGAETILTWYRSRVGELGPFVTKISEHSDKCSPDDLNNEKEKELYEILIKLSGMIHEQGLISE